MHGGQLPAFQRIEHVGIQLPHQLLERIIRRHEKRLLAIGRKVHVALRQFALETAADRFLAGALQIEGCLALPLSVQHPSVNRAHLQHVAKPLPQTFSSQVTEIVCPRTDGPVVLIQNPHHPDRQFAAPGSSDVEPRHRQYPRLRHANGGKIRLLVGPRRRMRKLQPDPRPLPAGRGYRVVVHGFGARILRCVRVIRHGLFPPLLRIELSRPWEDRVCFSSFHRDRNRLS
ncbi:hypothetical protein SAMN05421890_0255 [Ensifer adhaerens]|nr:hypothetical protein SAMN05421890_0255 [Ensifer adhaerens]